MGKIVRAADYPAVHIALVNRIFYNSENLYIRPASGVTFIPDEKSSVRAKVEHIFAVVKLQLRFRKARYRGLPCKQILECL